MKIRFAVAAAALALAPVTPLPAFQNPGAEQALAKVITTYLGMGLPADWSGLDGLPGITWAPLPATSLQNCLPDGSCFARQGAATLGGRNLQVVATGARTMVIHVYLRNAGAPIGEAAVLAALKAAALTADLARCPVRGGAGATNWYRLKGEGLSPAILAIQAPRGQRPTEGFVISEGEKLPPLQPNQVALYSEQCAPGAEQKPVSTLKPHERLAEVVTALLVPASTPATDWTTLAGLPTEITWAAGGPKAVDLSALNDPNPMSQGGSATWAGREFSVTASGTATQVKTIHLDEGGMHPRGEHMLGVVYTKGITVRLVRCGPVYTESTNNWYSLASARTRPAMIRQSIRYDGNQVQDSYELRLDGTLPARDPRDRDPGVNGCQ